MIYRFIQFYKPYKKLFFADMICALFVALADLFYPMIAKNIINDYVPNANVRLFLVWAVALLMIYLIKAGLNYFIQYYGHVMGVRIQGDMRETMFRHLQKLPFSYFDENKAGSIMSRLINDSMDISELAHHGPENLFLSLIVLMGSFVILCTINVSLTLIIFLSLPFVVALAVLMRKRMSRAFTKMRVEMAEVNADLENAIAGIRITRTYTNSDYENRKFAKFNQNYKLARNEGYQAMGQFFSSMILSTDLLYLVVLVGGGIFFFQGKINAGEFTMYLLYINSFLTPVRRLIDFFEQYQNGMTGFKRMEQIMQEAPEYEKPDAIDLPYMKGVIDFQDVSFSYPEKDEKSGDVITNHVIDHLSLHLEKGKTVALVGPSGSGKTTLCHLLLRFYDVSAGRILIDGHDINDLSRYSLRKHIGMVAQDVFLFTGTIRENIAYGDLDASEEAIIQAAKDANIHDYIMTLPEGYDTYIGERGIKLSGGQKQRISIARIFLKNPSILILDEATSALDNTTEMMIQNSLSRLAEGRTSIIVAHRLSTIKNADEILVLTNQGILERGTHEELLRQNGLYAQFYQYQFSV